MGWIHVTIVWANDPLRRKDGRCWRGCWGVRGLPHPKGHRIAGGEGGSGQE